MKEGDPELLEALRAAKTALKAANSLERTEPIDIVLDCIIEDISQAIIKAEGGTA